MVESGDSTQSFIYDAFISYRHVERDRKWAEWLIDALERYRVPKALQDRGLPPRLRKVFRDEDEVPASSDLNDQIKDALIASRFLIVVCSAFTPRSKWVEREIEIFNELGRGDHVLALLTEGEPGDSFPSAMLVRERRVVDPDGTTRILKEDKEPLAADVRPRKGQSTEQLKRLALLRLVATILGVKFDELRQRDHERERHGKVIWGAAAAVLVLILGGLGLLYWDMMRPATAHYRQIAWRWGVPEGLGPIDEDTRRHLVTNYAVTVQRSSILTSPKVKEVRRENSAGVLRGADSLRNDNEGRARWLVRYRDDGSVERIVGFDATDRLLSEEAIRRDPSSNRFIVSFERNNIPVARDAHAQRVVDPLNPGQRNVLEGRTEITRHVLSFDANGFVAERRYQSYYGKPRHDGEGSFGERLINSREGLVLHTTEIDAEGAEITLKNGIHAVTSAYDQDYNLVRYTLTGVDGRPIDGPNGFAYYDRQSDRWGNDLATTYYHPDGQAALHKDGYARYTVAYNDRGFQTGLSYFGLDGQSALVKAGFASFRRINDDRGYAVEEEYFGIDGKPGVIKNGFAMTKQTNDAHGRVVELRYFDVDGSPTLHKDGNAIFRRTYDSHGNVTEESYFGFDEQPTLIKIGISSKRYWYDDHDNLIRYATFGVHGRPTLDQWGTAGITYSYDDRGNYTRMAWFGVDENPVLHKLFGFAGMTLSYDARGDLTWVSSFDVDGRSMLQRTGVAGRTQAFDERGNLIKITFIGVDGKPKLNNENVAESRYRYDPRGNEVERAFFGLNGEPILASTGIAGERRAYDSQGNRVEVAYFALDGGLKLNNEGIAKIGYSYDARGNEIGRAFFGINGEPILASTGIATLRQAFDSRRNRIELAFFGLDGKPKLNTEGLAKVRYSYDARSNEMERTFFGINGEPTGGAANFAKMVMKYDARDNMTERSFFDVDGKRVMLRDGYSRIAWVYDARSNLIEEAYFDENDAQASRSTCAKIRYGYDDLGQETQATCLDAMGGEVKFEVAISRVIPGAVAARFGLAPGDRLLTYNGRKVTSIKRFIDLVSEPQLGYRSLTVRRGSEILTFSLPAGNIDADLILVRISSETVDAPGEHPKARD